MKTYQGKQKSNSLKKDSDEIDNIKQSDSSTTPESEDSGEYKEGTGTGSTEGQLNRDKSQFTKEQIQEGGSDRK